MKSHPYYPFDDHRLIAIPGDHDQTIEFSAGLWFDAAEKSIQDHHFFSVALSGGSTPKKIYEKIVESERAKKLAWEKIYLFWSDERSVTPDHPDSNYKMAMESFRNLRIPQENIFRMMAEKEIENNAKAYEATIKQRLGGLPFDLVMLGMGEDGHTASLFPNTQALHEDEKLVVANFVEAKKTFRMSLTYKCINAASETHIYVIGKSKAKIVETVFKSPFNPNLFPVQKIGTSEHPALWILDEEAAENLLKLLKNSK